MLSAVSDDTRAYTLDMNLRDIGEFGLIERIRAMLPANEDLVVPPGDDAAVWRHGNEFTVATTDTMVDGVHFRIAKSAAEDVGWKTLATNLSDIAAMGATPRFALVTLCLPADTSSAYVDALYAGIRDCAETYATTIAGGDIVSSPVLTINIAATGTAPARADGAPAILRRDSARPGDVIAVTGTLGGSAAGLRLLQSGQSCDVAKELIRRHMRPAAQVTAGHAAVAAGIGCAIDISDGLLQDIGHICEASRVAADLRAADIPTDPMVSACFRGDAITLALTGGEDYELILVGPAETIANARQSIDIPLTTIGTITEPRTSTIRVLDASGKPMHLPESGWNHFR